jgi:hypothetical protein
MRFPFIIRSGEIIFPQLNDATESGLFYHVRKGDVENVIRDVIHKFTCQKLKNYIENAFESESHIQTARTKRKYYQPLKRFPVEKQTAISTTKIVMHYMYRVLRKFENDIAIYIYLDRPAISKVEYMQCKNQPSRSTQPRVMYRAVNRSKMRSVGIRQICENILKSKTKFHKKIKKKHVFYRFFSSI